MKFSDVYDLLDELTKLDFGDYDVYYTECNHTPVVMSVKCTYEVLTEALIDPKRLMSNTDALRVTRGKDEVEILDYDISKADPKKYGQGYKILEYAVVADPTTEDKVHHGYIVYYQPNGKVHSVFCSCKNFFFSLYAPYVKAGLATFNLDRKYQEYSSMTHNRQWTDKTNPDGNLYLCKHLYKVMDDIMDSENFVKKLLDTDAEDERIQRDINGDEFGRNADDEKPKRTSIAKKKAPVVIEPDEPEEIEDELEELPPEEEQPEEVIPSEVEDEEDEPEEVIPSEVEEEPEEETEFDKDLEDIVPAKNIKVNYPKEKKPAPPAKIGTGFTPKKSKDTV